MSIHENHLEELYRSGLTDTTILTLLDGATHATAVFSWGPGPIRLPENASERAELVRAHIDGQPATVMFSPSGKPAKLMQVERLILGAYCPGADRLVRWVAIDLDAANGHGEGGLADPQHAARCLAERADRLGLSAGLLVNRSGGGRGIHVWMRPPEPVSLEHAVLAVASLAAQARKIADADVHAEDSGEPHAFRTANDNIATPGQSGAFELVPRSTSAPRLGWNLTLPMAGAYRERGGGIIIDPFTGQPVELQDVPRCSADAWSMMIQEVRQEWNRRRPRAPQRPVHRPQYADDPLSRISSRTQTFLSGRVEPGSRNAEAFSASANLIGCGVAVDEVERLVMGAAVSCGLTPSEARSAFRSACQRTRGPRR